MKLVRFLSLAELRALLEGAILENRTKHHTDHHSRSNSVGFCFFDDSVPPEKRMHYLTGVVSMDAVIEIETDMRLKKCYGWYRDPEKDAGSGLPGMMLSDIPMQKLTEYCTTKYSLKDIKGIRIGKPFLFPHRISWLEV